MSATLLVLAVALVLDRIVGDPPRLWNRVPHPVVLFGWAISALEHLFNGKRMEAGTRRFNGVVVIGALLVASLLVGYVIHAVLMGFGWFGLFLEAAVATLFFAQKSLADHVGAVATGLRRGGLAGGREAVAMIVGRDPATLDEPAVCRAAIESLAENFSDGVVAPAFWYALLGLPGLFAYKMLNTADSMIGHKNARYLEFGWASARLDDLANWPAARLSILLIAAGAWAAQGKIAARAALDVGLRDSGLHRSPNSGWPEAAMAGALGISLAGPRVYDGVRVEEPMINAAGRAVATADDIRRGLKIFGRACDALVLAAVAGAVLCGLFA